MNKRTVLGALLATALLLVPGTSYARWMNPNTGRFQTMDSFEGNQEDPLSLHKYLYGHANPVNRIDPSGKDDLTLVSVEAAGEIGAEMDALGAEAVEGAEVSAEETASVAEETEAEETTLITDNGFQSTVTENLEGQAGENTELVPGEYNGGTGFSRPDILDKANKVMTEIKNVKSQSLTKQIQIQISNVQNNPGWTYRMIFNTGKFTKDTMSGPLKSALQKIGAKVYTTIDGKVLTLVSLN